MKAIDSDILVRLIIEDESDQTSAAQELVANEGCLFVNRLAVVESVWVLSRSYRLDRSTIARELGALLESAESVFEDSDVIELALSRSIAANADLADLIVALSNERQGHGPTVTFDRKAAARIDGFELIG